MSNEFYVYYESNPKREDERVRDILELQRWCEVSITQVFSEDDFLAQLNQQACLWWWFNFYWWIKVEKKQNSFDKPVALVSCYVKQPQGEQLLAGLQWCIGIVRDRDWNWIVELSKFLDAKVVK